jgi:putative ABC transport system ATP-binding protein
MDDVVEMDSVSRSFGAVPALREVSLRVPAGRFVAVMGATGSGKSTLLHCAAGLDRPSAGRVRLAGREITRMREGPLTRLRRDRAGFVFQSYNLLSELTVRQNVALPGRLGGPRPRKIDEVLAAVGLDGLGRRPVGELSGGQRQRVAIARALITGPAVIFADEPTGALDPTTGAQILALLRTAADRDGVTVVMVTHDPVAAAWSDRVVLLRQGRVAADEPTPDAGTIAAHLRAVSDAPPGAGSLSPAGTPPGRAQEPDGPAKQEAAGVAAKQGAGGVAAKGGRGGVAGRAVIA